jgi:type I restriction enzyme R subunit/menaquinone-specific isochorismate synthase/putative DNA methylase
MMSEFRSFYRRRLPHYQEKDAIYFITFSLDGAIPASTAADLSAARQQALALAQQMRTTAERREHALAAERSHFLAMDSLLDRPDRGPRWLSRKPLAECVKSKILSLERKECDLFAFCIMCNHVHVVASIHSNISELVGPLKNSTAKECNLLLGRSGRFWRREWYDRIVRDERQLKVTIAYVRNNPVKAGLVFRWEDWPWTYVKEGW